MRVWLLIFLLFPAGAADITKTLIFGRSADGPVPVFDHGYMTITRAASLAVEIWGPDGLQHFFSSVDRPPGAWSVVSIAADSDGSAAAGFTRWAPDMVHGGIAYFDPSGKQSSFVDTGAYMPAHLSFDNSHSLWTFGWMRKPDGYEERSDYMTFRKYSAQGTEIGRYIPRSVLASRGLDSGSPVIGGWHLKAAGDRVGALASYRADSSKQAWVALAVDDGHLIGIWPLGRDQHDGIAFTSDDKLCRAVLDKTKCRIECLDRSTGTWKHTGEVPARGMLVGAEEDQFVFMGGEGVIRLYWLKP